MTAPDARILYDAMAPHYREYAARKSAYLEGVDRFVIENAEGPVDALLDLGAGDGVRGMALARRLGAARVVLCDPSNAMAEACGRHGAEAVWNCAAEELPDAPIRFDVILCLWNVLGHVEGRRNRVAAIRRAGELLSPRGALFLDVNNRHNAAAYGILEVARRVAVDAVAFKESRGDAHYSIEVGGAAVRGTGHLFTPHEVEGIIRESGLRVVARASVGYADGRRNRSPYQGQLAYKVVRDA